MCKEKKCNIIDLYDYAKKSVIAAGYENEILWQDCIDFRTYGEKDFLRESAWVILCSGFNEKCIRKVFNMISLCFCDWKSAKFIVEHKDLCEATALICFKNKKKIDSIIKIAEIIHTNGFENFKYIVSKNPIEELKKLPYIGEITSNHLAKNLGYNISKSDRHLQRMAQKNGYKSVLNFCSEISKKTGDKLSVVDIILWRFSVLVSKNKLLWNN